MLKHLIRIKPVLKPIRCIRSVSTGDRILPYDSFITWSSRDPVKLRMLSDNPPDNYPPILVPNLFRNTVERYPDQVAIVANRSGMSWGLKWTYERFGIKTYILS